MPATSAGSAGHTHSHGVMSRGMSDPAMAQAMEAQIRRRFWVSLVLSGAVFLLSPAGTALGVNIPLAAGARSWVMLALCTPVVWWCGWIFIGGSYDALRHRRLDMSVLIAVGVLAAYLSSVYLTVIGSPELYYEAAALLVTFVLFGHWMEMRSRRGTSDALRALFNLVPPKAHVVRDGREQEVPTAEVVRGDVVVLRPGDRVPVDGELLEGTSAVDESLVALVPVTEEIERGETSLLLQAIPQLEGERVVGVLVFTNYYIVLNSWAISLTPEWLLRRL